VSKRRGIVYLVGAGPGDPGLMTVRGMDVLKAADVVVYDRLVSAEILAHARADAQRIDVGKGPDVHRVKQNDINALLVERARGGDSVVRLKGGDPFVFGRGFEELVACRKGGVDCVVIPGVTSVAAVPASAGIPVTLRNVARTFAVITAKTASGLSPVLPDYDALSRIDTLVILMGRYELSTMIAGLIDAGRGLYTPVACISRGTTPDQREVVATLATVVEKVERAALMAPMVTIVGEVVAVSRAHVDEAIVAIYGRSPG